LSETAGARPNQLTVESAPSASGPTTLAATITAMLEMAVLMLPMASSDV